MLNSVNLFCGLFLKNISDKQKRHEAQCLHVFSSQVYSALACVIFLITDSRSLTLRQNSIVLITND